MESSRQCSKGIAVSDTIRISVQNRHSRTPLRDLLRGRMRKMHREPEVLEVKKPKRKNVSTAVQVVPQRNLHQSIL